MSTDRTRTHYETLAKQAAGEKVDVLAVLDDASRTYELQSDDAIRIGAHVGGGNPYEEARLEANKARAALAELINAAKDVERRAGPEREPRLRAALARIGASA